MIRRLPDLILKDFWLKLFSLALATLIWFTIFQAIQQQGSPVNGLNTNLKKRTFYNLPVSLMSSGSDVRSFKVNPGEVEVTVQGDAKSVDGLQAEDIKARVDLSGVAGDSGVHKRIEVSTPTGLACVKIEPAEVQVTPPPKGPPAPH